LELQIFHQNLFLIVDLTRYELLPSPIKNLNLFCPCFTLLILLILKIHDVNSVNSNTLTLLFFGVGFLSNGATLLFPSYITNFLLFSSVEIDTFLFFMGVGSSLQYSKCIPYNSSNPYLRYVRYSHSPIFCDRCRVMFPKAKAPPPPPCLRVCLCFVMNG
jgi:hypothetical protein